MNAPAKFKSPNTAFVRNGIVTNSIQHVMHMLDTTLNAILEEHLFYPADDIGQEQRLEAYRELHMMRDLLEQMYLTAGVERYPGSVHLCRHEEETAA